jgi:hypothetical protein
MVVMVLGLAAVVMQHLMSSSTGRAVSPEDFAGACAPFEKVSAGFSISHPDDFPRRILRLMFGLVSLCNLR